MNPCPLQDEKEQLTEFKTHLEGLKRRAKTIVQLKPRNPATAIKGKQPVQAVCDFKQMEVGVLNVSAWNENHLITQPLKPERFNVVVTS